MRTKHYLSFLTLFLFLYAPSLTGQTLTMPTGINVGLTAYTCSATFVDNGGTSNYSNNQRTRYTICPDAPGAKIEATFNTFNIESAFDSLVIFNGNVDEYDWPLFGNPAVIGVFWGTNSPGVVTSTAPSGCLTFYFSSDFSITRPGWSASISCAANILTMPTGINAGLQANTCGATFVDNGGTSNYSNNQRTRYTICPDAPGAKIEATFNTFNIESAFDSLVIFNGNVDEYDWPLFGNPAVIGVFWGTNSPGVVTSTAPSGCLTFYFSSDFSVTRPGWSAIISCVGGCGLPTAACKSATVQLDGNGVGDLDPGDVNDGSMVPCGIASEIVMPSSFDCDDIGNPVSVMYTIEDINGATSSCNTTVTVEDNNDPTAVCANPTVNLTSDATTFVAASFFDGGSSAVCGGLTFSASQLDFDCDDVGNTIPVTLTVTADNTQTATCTAMVTVTDDNSFCCAPADAVCNNTTVQLNASGMASIMPSDVGGGSTAECGLMSESAMPMDFTCADLTAPVSVTYTITDINGASDNCTAMVTVEDNIPPTPVCKTTTVQLSPDNGMYTLLESDVYDANASSDNCSIDNVSFPAITYDCGDEDQTFPVTVTVTDAGGNMVNCSATITVVVGNALPGGWSANDVGNSGFLGNEYSFDPCTPTNGEFAITGGGNNATSSTTDNVAFASQTLCGNNVSITAKIESVTPNGYGGLMIRETTAAGAKQVAIFSNLTYVLRHETRYTTNGPKQVNSFFKPLPTWLRLQRQGDWIFAYYSNNGVNFSYVHGVFVPMSSCVEVGLASFTYLPGQQTTAVFSDVSIGGGSAPTVEVPTITEAGTSRQLPGLYPNPTRNIANLVFEDGLSNDATIILRNQLGQVVEQRQLRAGDYRTEWDVSSLADGLYLFEIRQEGEDVQVLRLVKTQ